MAEGGGDGTGTDGQGVLFVAVGADHLELAVDAARSVRASNPGLAVDLRTDQAAHVPPGLFDQVRPIAAHPRAKITAMPESRFARTLYLDSDTRVVADVRAAFQLLDRFELALAHDVRRKSALVQEGWQVDAPYAFPQHNSGVMYYRRSPAMAAFFARWAEMYAAAGVARDQVTLRDLLWESDLRYYVLPPEFNLRRVTMLDAWEPLDAEPTIYHSHVFQQHLREEGAARVREIEAVLEIERKALAEAWVAEGRPARKTG